MVIDSTGEVTPRERQPADGLTRRDAIRLFGVGAAGLALGGRAAQPARAQDATAEPDPEAEADPEAETPEATAVPGGTPVGSTGQVTIYSGRQENLVGPLIGRFEGATGVDAAVRYAGTPELALQILDEGDNSPADVFLAQDAGFLGLLANEGRFQKLPDELLARVDPRFRSPDGFWVGVSGRARVAVYNTDKLTEADLPASVLDFTDPKWKGQIGWAPENASFQAFVTALRLVKGEEAARAWLEAMQANDPVAFGSNDEIVAAVGRGEIQVGLANHYYVYELKAAEGEDFPVANHFFADGDPGALINVAGVGVLDGAANAEQALRFVDYLLQRDAQTYFAEETFEYPLIEGVPSAGDLKPLAEIESPDLDLSDDVGRGWSSVD